MQNISAFGREYRRLVVMVREGSPLRVMLVTSDPFLRMIDKVLYNKETGQIIEIYHIESTETPDLIHKRERQGYKVIRRTRFSDEIVATI